MPVGAQAVEEAIEQVIESEKAQTSTPRKGEEGLTVRVLPPSVWRGTVPPVEHWPFAFIDVFTGASFADPDSPIGKAQKYGDDSFADVDYGSDFRRLEDISAIQVRLTTQTGSGGSCSITLQNDLEKIDGTWKRKYFKRGRFYDGASIRYMSSSRGERKNDIWFRGILKKTSGQGDVTLDGIAYVVSWDADGDRPEEARGGRLIAENVFAEDMGEPIFEPMQKLKIFAGNRFLPEVLSRFGYRSIAGNIPHMFMPGKSIPLTELLDFRNNIVDPRTGERVPSAAYERATNIFTGYVTDVSSSQAGGRWTMSVTARDVTCWLDYSMLNINPSLNIFNLDVVNDAELKNWMIFTTRFEGMPAHEIIRAIFLGLKEARTKTSAYLYSSYEGDAKRVGTDKKPIQLPPGARVYVHGSYPSENEADYMTVSMRMHQIARKAALTDNPVSPHILERIARSLEPVRYLVGTDLGDEGWVKRSDLGTVQQSYLGIGHFILDNDPGTLVEAVPKGFKEIIETFARDRLILDPAEKGSVDEFVVQAYRTFFRRNWPLIQSEYATRRSIVNEVCKHTNSELYADGGGRIWFHPVRAYTPVMDPVYIVHPEDTLSWEIAISDREIVTWAHVHGQYDFHIIPGEWIYNNEFTSEDMVKRFGVRAVQLSNPNVMSQAGARTYARAMLRRINANMTTGRVTMILRPEIQLARNVFIPWLNLIGYIAAIDHNVQWGRAATTTLSLKYIRHPWDPWYPLEYKAREEQDRIDNAPRTDAGGRITQAIAAAGYTSVSRYPTTSYSRAPGGDHSATRQGTSERELGAAGRDESMVTVQGHKIVGSALDAYSRAIAKLQRPVVGDESIKVTLIKSTEGLFKEGDDDPHKYGLAIDVRVPEMGNVVSTSPGYEYIKRYLDKASAAFRKEGFVVRNMYDAANNSKLKEGERGYLSLIYARLPDKLKGSY